MLHTVNKSPFERNALEACLGRSTKGSPVVLYEDAVYAATKGANGTSAKLAQAAKDRKVYVLGPDLKARGFDESQVMDGVTIIDYETFVDLVVEHGTVNSWL